MPKVSKQVSTSKQPHKKASVIDRIEPLNEGLQSGYKFNVYGPSGSGKTTFWATFPKPILAIIRSGAKRPGELLSIDTPSYRKTIKKVTLESAYELVEIVDYVRSSGEFKTVVLDHASGLQDLILKEVSGLEEIPEQLSWGIASREQWGQVGAQTKEYLRLLLDLDQHVVIVAQERVFNVENGESELITPFVASSLIPSTVGWLNPACDYIVETFIRQRMEEKTQVVGNKKVSMSVPGKGVEYCLRTAPHPVYTTKFRVPKGNPLPDVIVDPTFEKVDKLICGV